MLALVLATSFYGAWGHGAVANPSGRVFQQNTNCQWCMGEMKHDGSNPPGTVNRNARLSSPCMGTQRGDGTRPNWGPYSDVAGNFDRPTYTAGQSFEATIAMNANHQGDAQWQFCAHSEAETEECFRQTVVKDWEEVNCHFNDCGAAPHANNRPYKETVNIPSSLPSGPGTLRWYWVCRETNEIFTSCIDVDIVGGGPPTPAPAPGGGNCAAEGDDCSSSSCCADASLTCYRKDQYWASCRADCTAGSIWSQDPPQYQSPWACDVIGVRGTPTSAPAPATPAPTPAATLATPSPKPIDSATPSPKPVVDTAATPSPTTAPDGRTDCEDSSDECLTWALNGECQKNPDHMMQSCPRACGRCGSFLSGATAVGSVTSVFGSIVLGALASAWS